MEVLSTHPESGAAPSWESARRCAQRNVDPAGAVQRYKLTAAAPRGRPFSCHGSVSGERAHVHSADHPRWLRHRSPLTGGSRSGPISPSSCGGHLHVRGVVRRLSAAVDERRSPGTCRLCTLHHLVVGPMGVDAECGQLHFHRLSRCDVFRGGAAGDGREHRPQRVPPGLVLAGATTRGGGDTAIVVAGCW